MAYSYNVYTGNGSTTQFTIGFPYIRREHIKVYVAFVDTAYTYVNSTTVQLATAPGAGVRVEVRRVTPATSPLVDFANGSTLVAADLDTSNLQHLYLEQELDDSLKQTVYVDPATGLLTAANQRITNVADPTSAQDAATKNYVDTQDALRLKRDGTQAMTGALPMGGFKVTGLGAGTSSTDAVTKGQFDTGVASAAADAAAAAASAILANDWATKTSGAVAGGEFSAKYHAQASATSAAASDSSKVAAQTAQTAAETARDQTLAAYDSFDDRYLGTKASDPTLDNDGNALIAGALYFNSTSGAMKLYTGTVWVAAYVPGVASSIGFTPYGGIATTNVQAAVQELDDEKLPKAGGTMTGVLAVTAGTAALPGLAVSGDTNTGIYSPGADQLAIATGGTGRIIVDASGNVNIDSNTLYVDAVNNRVGINTPSPSSVLDVASSNSGITLTNTGASNKQWRLGGSSAGSFVITETGISDRLTIDSSGRLLVGTSTARSNFENSTLSAAVQIEGTNYAGSRLALIRNGGGGGINLCATGGASVGSNTAVSSSAELGEIVFAGSDGSEFVNAARISAVVDGTPGDGDMPGRLVFSTTADGAASPTERMRISQNGVLDYFSSVSSTFLPRCAQAANTSNQLIQGCHSATNTQTGTVSFIVYTNGNVQNTNNSYGAISDVKLKENIVNANSQWSDIKALQVRNYNLKEGQTHTQIGLVAQEVELVSPGLVYESPDRDEKGNDLGTVTKSVNYSVLYMKAVKALQEAMERIETLETRLSALEGA